MNKKEEILSEITVSMDKAKLTLEDRLEIIANILIREGLNTIPEEFLPDRITPENLMDTVLSLKAQYPETIGTATLHQGLVLLMWLEK